MKLRDIVSWLDDTLQNDQFDDLSLNGLQLGDLDANIQGVAVGVDANLASFTKVVEQSANLYICHHGLFWGACYPIIDRHYRRFELLIKQQLAVYASHIPLDAHEKFGNNAVLAARLGLTACEPFGRWRGKMIGSIGTRPSARPVSEIGAAIEAVTGLPVVGCGERMIQRVAVMTGAADIRVHEEAIARKADLLVTGESNHPTVAVAEESGLSVICAGHYATETLGPKAIGQELNRLFNLPVVFIDHPSGK